MSTTRPSFASDPRMKLNEQTGKWFYVGEDNVSYEYDEKVGAWFPMVKCLFFILHFIKKSSQSMMNS